VTIGDEIYVNGGSVLPHKSIKQNVDGKSTIRVPESIHHADQTQYLPLSCEVPPTSTARCARPQNCIPFLHICTEVFFAETRIRPIQLQLSRCPLDTLSTFFLFNSSRIHTRLSGKTRTGRGPQGRSEKLSYVLACPGFLSSFPSR
jgi:hypothetical protein